MTNEQIVFVGTYSVRGSQGIYSVACDQHSGKLRILSTHEAQNPSFLSLAPGGDILYAAYELSEFNGEPGGAVAAFTVDRATGTLSQLGEPQATHGVATCHLHVADSRDWIVAANYGDGTHSLLPLHADGSVGPLAAQIANEGAAGPAVQQDSAHAHSTTFVPDGDDLAFACDLGLDRVIVYQFGREDGQITAVEEGSVTLEPGSGPRHLVMHPTLPVAYVINELNSTIAVIDRSHGSDLAVVQTVSTLPSDYTSDNACADIHFSPDHRFLYGSNRGHDSLVTFEIDDRTGLLTSLGHTSVEGHWPRNFAVLASGLILVAGERSDSIAVFRIGGDGVPVYTGEKLAVPSPTCIEALVV